MVDRAVLTELEQRLTKGEQYLERTDITDREPAKALYYRLLAEYVALKEEEERLESIRVVTMDLPEHCQWQRVGYDTIHSRVRVLFSGQPTAANECTKAELSVLLNDRREALEMARGQRK